MKLLFCILYLASFVWFVYAALTAPLGEETERGFRFTDKKDKRQ